MTEEQFEKVYENVVNLHEGRPVDPDYMIFIQEIISGGCYFRQEMISDADRNAVWTATTSDELHTAYFEMLYNIVKMGVQWVHGPFTEV